MGVSRSTYVACIWLQTWVLGLQTWPYYVNDKWLVDCNPTHLDFYHNETGWEPIYWQKQKYDSSVLLSSTWELKESLLCVPPLLRCRVTQGQWAWWGYEVTWASGWEHTHRPQLISVMSMYLDILHLMKLSWNDESVRTACDCWLVYGRISCDLELCLKGDAGVRGRVGVRGKPGPPVSITFISFIYVRLVLLGVERFSVHFHSVFSLPIGKDDL